MLRSDDDSFGASPAKPAAPAASALGGLGKFGSGNLKKGILDSPDDKDNMLFFTEEDDKAPMGSDDDLLGDLMKTGPGALGR